MLKTKTENKIPESWEIRRLGEICFTTSGGTPSRKISSYYEGTIPWVKSGELEKGTIKETEEYISQDALKNSSAKIFPKGTLLIALYGATIGKLGFLGVDAATNQAVCGIFQNDIVDLSFLKHFLFFNKRKLVEQSAGGAQPNISQAILKDLSIVIPPANEQKRIVAKIEELFSRLDAGVDSLKKAQAQLKTYRQAVLKWAFEGKLCNTANLTSTELKNLCISVKYGSSAKSKEAGRIPVLRMGNIQAGKFDWSDLVFSDDEDEIKRYLLKKNDVLFNRTNSPELVGKTAIYKGERPAIFAGYLIRINYRPEVVNPDYLTYYMNSQAAKNYGNAVKSFGVNQSNINGTKLKCYPIPICTLEEQARIVEEIESRLSVCDKLEESIAQGLKQAEALKQSILKKAFEGKLVPQNPDDEPAGVLLDRIRSEREKPVATATKNSTTASKKKKSCTTQ